MPDVVFYNFFLQKILIKSYKYDGIIPFDESLLRCNIYLVLRIVSNENRHLILGQSILFLFYHVTKIFVN